jgi:hypothetical protein
VAALSNYQFHCEMWVEFLHFLHSRPLLTSQIPDLYAPLVTRLLPNSLLVTFYLAECFESDGRVDEGKQVLEKLISNVENESSLLEFALKQMSETADSGGRKRRASPETMGDSELKQDAPGGSDDDADEADGGASRNGKSPADDPSMAAKSALIKELQSQLDLIWVFYLRFSRRNEANKFSCYFRIIYPLETCRESKDVDRYLVVPEKQIAIH